MKRFCPICEEGLKITNSSAVTCNGCGWSGLPKKSLMEPKLPEVKLPYVSIDIETTGLDPMTCQTLEIGAILDDWKTPIGQLQQFHQVLTYETVSGSPFAMALNANLLKQIANPPETCEFCKPEELGERFAAWITTRGLDPLHLQAAGKNFASFDMQFLYRVPNFKTHIAFRHRVLDPAVLYWEVDDEKLPDSKTCCERAGIDNKVAHTAVEDALAVVRLVRHGIKRLWRT